MHILSPETDNCPSWISGRERVTVENISWSITTKECCRPRRGLNPRPPGLQSDGASNWATEAGSSYLDLYCFQMCVFVCREEKVKMSECLGYIRSRHFNRRAEIYRSGSLESKFSQFLPVQHMWNDWKSVVTIKVKIKSTTTTTTTYTFNWFLIKFCQSSLCFLLRSD